MNRATIGAFHNNFIESTDKLTGIGHTPMLPSCHVCRHAAKKFVGFPACKRTTARPLQVCPRSVSMMVGKGGPLTCSRLNTASRSAADAVRIRFLGWGSLDESQITDTACYHCRVTIFGCGPREPSVDPVID